MYISDLNRYVPYCERIEVEDSTASDQWQCRDVDDQLFIELAVIERADILVTGDKDLLDMRGETPFVIETPSEYRLRIIE